MEASCNPTSAVPRNVELMKSPTKHKQGTGVDVDKALAICILSVHFILDTTILRGCCGHGIPVSFRPNTKIGF